MRGQNVTFTKETADAAIADVMTMEIEGGVEFEQVLAEAEARMAAVLADFKRATARELRAREERDRKLVEERRAFEAEKAYVSVLNAQADDRIHLNVGGQRFETTRQTLCAFPSSMLAAWFSGRHVLKTGTDGEVFIDRNGSHFGAILDYCRTKQAPALSPDEEEREALWREFDYFCLPVPGRVLQSPIYDIFSGGYEVVDMPYPSMADGSRVGSLFTSTHVAVMFGTEYPIVVIWDTTTGQICRQIRTEMAQDMFSNCPPMALEYPYFAGPSGMQSLAVWDIPSGEKLWHTDVPFVLSTDGGMAMHENVVVAIGTFTFLPPNGDGSVHMGIPMRAWRAETGEFLWEALCTVIPPGEHWATPETDPADLPFAYILARDGRVLIGKENVFAIYDIVSGEHVFTGMSTDPDVRILDQAARVRFHGNRMHLISPDRIVEDTIDEEGQIEEYTRRFIHESTWDLSLGIQSQNVVSLPETEAMIYAMGSKRKAFYQHMTMSPYNTMWYVHDNHIACIRWTPAGNTNTFHKQTLYVPRPEDNQERGVEVFAGLEVFDDVLYFFGRVPGPWHNGHGGPGLVERLVALKPRS